MILRFEIGNKCYAVKVEIELTGRS